jgi:hypothetical protein
LVVQPGLASCALLSTELFSRLAPSVFPARPIALRAAVSIFYPLFQYARWGCWNWSLSPPLTLPAGIELYPNCCASAFDLPSYSCLLKPWLEVHIALHTKRLSAPATLERLLARMRMIVDPSTARP